MRTSTPATLEQLVAHQIQRWKLEEARSRAPRPRCIAMSRLPGSGGAEIGLRVAEELGFGFFGIEIVDQIARERHVQRHLVAGLDEHLRGAVDRWVDGFRTPRFSESEYQRGLLRTLATLSERGMAVILGRGSPHVLPQDRTLRVLVVAPRRARIERLAKARSLSTTVASHRTDYEDGERQRFIRHHFHVDPDEPALYDLVVNSDSLGVSCCAELIVRGFRERFPEIDAEHGRARRLRSVAPSQELRRSNDAEL